MVLPLVYVKAGKREHMLREFLRCINYFKMPEYSSPFYCIPEQSSCIAQKACIHQDILS